MTTSCDPAGDRAMPEGQGGPDPDFTPAAAFARAPESPTASPYQPAITVDEVVRWRAEIQR